MPTSEKKRKPNTIVVKVPTSKKAKAPVPASDETDDESSLPDLNDGGDDDNNNHDTSSDGQVQASYQELNAAVNPISNTNIEQVNMKSLIMSFNCISDGSFAKTELQSFGERFKSQQAPVLAICMPSPIQRPFAWPDEFVINLYESIYELFKKREDANCRSVCRFGTLIYHTSHMQAIPSLGTKLQDVPKNSTMVLYTVVDGNHRLTVKHILDRVCLYYLHMCARNMKKEDSATAIGICEELGRKLVEIDQLTFKTYPRFNLGLELLEDHRKWFEFDTVAFLKGGTTGYLEKIANRKFDEDDFKYPGQFMRIAHCGTLASDFIRSKFFYTGNSKLPVLSDNQNWMKSFGELNKFIHCMQNYCYVDAVIQYGSSDPKDLTKEFNQLNWWREPLKWEDVAKSFITSVQLEETNQAMMKADVRARELAEIRADLDNFKYNRRNNNKCSERNDPNAVSNYIGVAIFITTHVCDPENKAEKKTSLPKRIEGILSPANGTPLNAETFMEVLREVRVCLVLLLKRPDPDHKFPLKYMEYLPSNQAQLDEVREVLTQIRLIMVHPMNEALLCICAALRKGRRGAAASSRIDAPWKKIIRYLKVIRSLMLLYLMREAFQAPVVANRRPCFVELFRIIVGTSPPKKNLNYFIKKHFYTGNVINPAPLRRLQEGLDLTENNQHDHSLLAKIQGGSHQKKPYYMAHFVILALREYKMSSDDGAVQMEFLRQFGKINLGKSSSLWTYIVARDGKKAADHIGNFALRIDRPADPGRTFHTCNLGETPSVATSERRKKPDLSSVVVHRELKALEDAGMAWDAEYCTKRIKEAYTIFCEQFRSGLVLTEVPPRA